MATATRCFILLLLSLSSVSTTRAGRSDLELDHADVKSEDCEEKASSDILMESDFVENAHPTQTNGHNPATEHVRNAGRMAGDTYGINGYSPQAGHRSSASGDRTTIKCAKPGGNQGQTVEVRVPGKKAGASVIADHEKMSWATSANSNTGPCDNFIKLVSELDCGDGCAKFKFGKITFAKGATVLSAGAKDVTEGVVGHVTGFEYVAKRGDGHAEEYGLTQDGRPDVRILVEFPRNDYSVSTSSSIDRTVRPDELVLGPDHTACFNAVRFAEKSKTGECKCHAGFEVACRDGKVWKQVEPKGTRKFGLNHKFGQMCACRLSAEVSKWAPP